VRPAQDGVSAGARDEFLNFPSSAYLKITEGCSNCCSFCAIPLIRGRLRSRTIPEIVAEFKELLSKGIFEVNLIGQDLAAFGRDGVTPGDSGNAAYFKEPSPLSQLLRALSAVPGNFWVRLLYIHPDHFPLDILPVLKADRRILPYFDIPFQSGSTSVIKAMNRCGSAESYLALAEKLRSEVGAVVRTTFLCGFPGETEENATEAEAFLGALQPDWSGCFSYSREEDTPAYSMKKQVPAAKAAKRVERLQELQTRITEERLKERIGKTYDVLIEELLPTVAPGADESSVSDADVAGVACTDEARVSGASLVKANAVGSAPVADAADSEEPGLALGRAWFQAPDVDGTCVIRYDLDDKKAVDAVSVGKVVTVKVLAVNGVDLDTIFVRAVGADSPVPGAAKSGAGAHCSEKPLRPASECSAGN
jgi:ribosomal protein S12 methylthiotransferase